MKPDTIKIALFGLGYMGQNHLRVLDMLKDVEIAFVYDINENLARKVAAQYGVAYLADFSKALDNVDAAVIATPTNTHLDYIISLAPKIQHLFVEKPLTDDLSSTQKAFDIIKAHNVKIQIGFIERYNPAVAILHQTMTNANQVINIDFERTNKASKRIKDVDVVVDLMIHDIDLAISFNGLPKQISAYGYVQNNSIDYARAVLAHENGVFSNLLASRITEKRIRQINVTCENMLIDCNLLSKEVFVHKQSIAEQYLANVTISAKTESMNVPPREALLLEFMDFVALCKNQPIKERANEYAALHAMQIATTIQEKIYDLSRRLNAKHSKA